MVRAGQQTAGTTDRRLPCRHNGPPAPGRHRPPRLALAPLLLLFCLLSAAGATADDIRATATVDNAKIPIGDQIHLRLEIIHPEGITVSAPENLPELLKPLEVIHAEDLKTTRSDSGTISSMTVTLTSFDAGAYTIPALPFKVQETGSSEPGVVSTTALNIEVRNVDVDTKGDIKDVKPPQDVPLSWREILPYALAGAALVVLIWLLSYIWKKRRRGERILPAAPPRPAHELALEALRSLEARRLWQNGQVKEYHSELTDILRTYIERKYEVPAMEMTTEDILTPGILERWTEPLRKDLSDVLTLADFVKFARVRPAPDENERGMRLAVSFVETTSTAPAAVEPQAGSAQS